MNDKQPTVSVLMTAYNREKYIAEAIESVLNSTYQDFELIIVDDKSSDKTLFIANEYALKDSRIKVFSNEINLGDYNNRNNAASKATGKYLKYVDSDDIIYPYSLAVMVDAMEKWPEASVGIISRIPQEEIPFPYLITPSEIFESHFFCDGCLDIGPLGFILKRTSFIEFGGFSGKRFVGDTELLLGMALQFSFVKIQSGLVYWRKHDTQEIREENKTSIRVTETKRIYTEILYSDLCPLSKDKVAKIFRELNYQSNKVMLKRFLKARILTCKRLVKL